MEEKEVVVDGEKVKFTFHPIEFNDPALLIINAGSAKIEIGLKRLLLDNGHASINVLWKDERHLVVVGPLGTRRCMFMVSASGLIPV